MSERLRFDRNEWAGSIGDAGIALPLIIGMTRGAGLDSASVFIMFGLMQIGTGLVYGLPMPVQPLKAMAVLVIARGITGDTLFGAGLAIGVMMLVLAASGALERLARLIPLCVVRGIQFGLGLSLAFLALRQYIPSQGVSGGVAALAALAIIVGLRRNRRFPAGLFVLLLGLIYVLLFKMNASAVMSGLGLGWPRLHRPALDDVLTGAVVLALPQLPLSLANSVLATRQTLDDLFPERKIGIRPIGLTYSVMNMILPFFSGVPVCHGCGGLAGYYAFGARTGGSVIISGSVYLVVGLFMSRVVDRVTDLFPLPILGVVLLFEAMTLMLLLRDQAASKPALLIALLVGLMALLLPQGYVVGLIAGTLLFYLSARIRSKVAG
jgi:hypothetical protein